MTPNEEAALAELVFELSAPHTLEEIAEHLGISLRHVSRIEARALAKLRGLLEAHEDWGDGLSEPPTLARRCGEIFPSNGSTPKGEAEG